MFAPTNASETNQLPNATRLHSARAAATPSFYPSRVAADNLSSLGPPIV
jgi:hypothetical protein